MANILNLPDWEILDVKEDRSSYRIFARYEPPPAFCPTCGLVDPPVYRFGTRENVFADLPHHGKRTEIHVHRQRYRCRSCGKGAFLEPLPHMDEDHHATKRLVSWVEQQALRHPFAQVAKQVDMGESTVRRIFLDFSERLLAKHRPKAPSWMGIDEIHLMGKPRAVFTNLKSRSVIDMLEGRSKLMVTDYLLHLPGRERTEVVAMDQWPPYRDAVRTAMPQAAVVIDKFHIVAAATQGLEGVRKSIRKGLNSRQRVQLKDDRFLLLKRASKLKDDERLIVESWGNRYPDLVLAWNLKEEFYAIYDAESKEEARERMHAWLPKVPAHFRTKEKFKKAVDALKNWEPEILAYWDYPATNAYTESLNNQIRSIERQGRGYPRFDVLKTKVVFTPPGWAEKRLRERLPEGMPESMRFLPEGWKAMKFPGLGWCVVPESYDGLAANDAFAIEV